MTDDPAPHDPRPPRRAGERRPAARRPADLRRTVLLVVAVVVVLGFFVFWLQNHYRVSISYLTVEVRAPLWLVVSGYFLVGVLVGALLTVYYQRRRP